MIRYIKRIILIVSIFLFSSHCFGQSFTTTIKGKIKGQNVDSLYIFKATEDHRAGHTTITVVDGKFDYKISSVHREAYEIYFPNYPTDYIVFFIEPGKVNLTLYPGTPEKNSAKGGKLTNDYYSFLHTANNKFFDPLDITFNRLDSFKNKKENSSNVSHINSKIKKYEERIDSLTQASLDYQTDYIANNTTLHSYFWLYKSLNEYKYVSQMPQYETADISKLETFYEEHAQKFPSHPYTSITETQIEAIKQVQVGNNYRDFKAPDLQGNQKQLSNLINGKIALLNLWASWCGPCIRKSRNMIPIYKKYNVEEFTIIGVAREFENTSKLEKALNREEFPWKNLVDLDDKYSIWRKYDIPFSGGGMFLIGKDGKILAVNPSAEEVEKILQNRL